MVRSVGVVGLVRVSSIRAKANKKRLPGVPLEPFPGTLLGKGFAGPSPSDWPKRPIVYLLLLPEGLKGSGYTSLCLVLKLGLT